MMKYETMKELDEEKFRRLTGVKRTTFNKMFEILEQSIQNRGTTIGIRILALFLNYTEKTEAQSTLRD